MNSTQAGCAGGVPESLVASSKSFVYLVSKI